MAMEAHRVVRRGESRTFWRTASQIALRMSALRVGRILPPERFLVLLLLEAESIPEQQRSW
jgi:hypothetical protein